MRKYVYTIIGIKEDILPLLVCKVLSEGKKSYSEIKEKENVHEVIINCNSML